MRTRLSQRDVFMLLVIVFCGGSIALVVLSGSTTSRQQNSLVTQGNKRILLLTGRRVHDAKPTATKEFMFMRKTVFDGVASGNTTKRTTVNISDVNVFGKEDLASSSITGPKRGDTNHNLSPTASKRVEAASSSRLASEGNGECRPQRASQRMENFFGDKFNSSFEPFLTMGTLRALDADMRRLPLPFGLNGSETEAMSLVQKLPEAGIPNTIRKLPCRRCVVVGNGGLLKGSQAGRIIDRYDVIIRLNMAPVDGYEVDVGSKTTMRLMYPESSAMKSEEYTPGWLLVVVPFKRIDITWAENVAEGKKMQTKGFWQRTASFVPKSKKEVRLYNPQVIRELANDLIGFKVGTGRMAKNVPTTGAMAIAIAIRVCDEVSVAGFGYGGLKPGDPVHYYKDKQTMKLLTDSRTHDIGPERKMLRTLARQGIIQDLTKGLL